MTERVFHRSKNPPEESFEISGEMFDNYLQYWQPPEEDEEFILAEQILAGGDGGRRR
jgi:hypothetical protein